MRKGSPPACLEALRRELRRIERETGHAHPDPWSEMTSERRDEVRAALRRDQDGLCAYCGAKLGDDMRIEHFVPRAKAPSLAFDWENLLGVCAGWPRFGVDRRPHCDRNRKPWVPGPPERGVLHIHPAGIAPDPEKQFPVRLTGGRGGLGVIEPASPEAELDVEELNLNAESLVRNRAEVIRRLQREIGAARVPREVFLRHRLASARAPGELPPYAHVVAAWCAWKLRTSLS